MGHGPVGEWPSGGRAQQCQCQTPVFLTAFIKTNDQYGRIISKKNQFTPWQKISCITDYSDDWITFKWKVFTWTKDYHRMKAYTPLVWNQQEFKSLNCFPPTTYIFQKLIFTFKLILPSKKVPNVGFQLGVVHKLRWQDFGFFWPPTPLRWHLLQYERWQKVDILRPPTYLVL